MAYTTEPLARIIFAVYGMLLIVRAGSFKGGFMNAPFKSKSLKQDKAAWEKADIKLYSYDDTQVEATANAAMGPLAVGTSFRPLLQPFSSSY